MVCGCQLALFAGGLVLSAGMFNRWCDTPQHGTLESLSGLNLFLLGPLGLLSGTLAAVPWIANVLVLGCSALVGAGRYRLAMAASVVTLGVAAAFDGLARAYPFWADEGGVCHYTLTTLGLGYWLWVGELAIPLLASGMILAYQRRPTAQRTA